MLLRTGEEEIQSPLRILADLRCVKGWRTLWVWVEG